MKFKPILLVEDDAIDIFLLKDALKRLNITNRLVVARNGEEAIRILKNLTNERPGIILLDLNMPRMNGLEFLRIIKEDNQLKMIPVIILTTSNDKKDIIETFRYNIAGYIVKPVEHDDFIETMKTVSYYWSLNQLPID